MKVQTGLATEHSKIQIMWSPDDLDLPGRGISEMWRVSEARECVEVKFLLITLD